MSLQVKPAIVLVHGAWHVPKHYSEFIQQLQRAGFDAFCPLLPTCDEKKKFEADLFQDAQVIRDQIMALIEKGRGIIMLLHSYGGAVGTEAVKGLSDKDCAARKIPGRILHLIYMCAFMLQVGESVGGASLPRPSPDPVATDEATATTHICEPGVPLFYADVKAEQAEKMDALRVSHSSKAMVDAVTYPAWQYTPTTYLKTTQDRVLFPDWQGRQIKAVRDVGISLNVESFKASHSPFLSMPEDMVGVVKKIAEGLVSSENNV